jgi:hypothetical protein
MDTASPEAALVAPSTMLWNSIHVGGHGGWADAGIGWFDRNINPPFEPQPSRRSSTSRMRPTPGSMPS